MKESNFFIISIILLVITTSILIVTSCNYLMSKNNYNSLDETHMQQQKEYWQDIALMTYLDEWPKFIVEFDNKTGYLSCENGGDGNVTIMIDNPDVILNDYGDQDFFKYQGNNTWVIYAVSGLWFRTTIIYQDNISFNITIIKDIKRFYNPFIDNKDDWYDFPDKEIIIGVKT